MKKGIAAAVVVIVIAIAAWYIFGNNSSNNNSSLYGSNNNSSETAKQPASNNNNTAGTQPESAGKVTIANMAFTPSQITVNKGETVTWTNNDSVTHRVVDDLSNVDGPNSGDIAPGSSYSFTFTKTGSFQYHCSIHPSMRGTIVVK